MNVIALKSGEDVLISFINFLKQYIISMRLYYAFVTGIAGWIGVDFYQHIALNFNKGEVITPPEKKFVILILLFLSWGVNQIINDFLGLKEDKINAPHRPMVTGELNPAGAVMFSAFLLVTTAGIIYFYLQPIALIPLFAGVVLNIIYEYSKAYGIIANIVFGLMISMCSIFGYLASGPSSAPYFTKSRLSVLFLIWLMNGLMTYYTYFKDYYGDKLADKKTLVVRLGINRSRILGIFSALLPTIAFLVIYNNNLIVARTNNIFIILGFLTFFLQLWTGFLYYKYPSGEKTYYSLAVNFRACVCGQAALIALFNAELAMILFLVSYIFVGFIFDLHTDSKS